MGADLVITVPFELCGRGVYTGRLIRVVHSYGWGALKREVGRCTMPKFHEGLCEIR